MKPRVAVFSGPTATVSNSPPLVTGNKGRLRGERTAGSGSDHLVPQFLYEPVTVKIRKFSAHPLEADAAEMYHDDGKEYYEVTLSPEDGPYPLPYVARRADGSGDGAPFEAADLNDAGMNFGGRQTFYPDASRIFMEIDRTVHGRRADGEGGPLSRRAEYDFIRVLPPGGYTKKGEVAGRDFFPYRPEGWKKRPRAMDLARVANALQGGLASGLYAGCLWLEGTPSLEETLYWASLLVDTELPIAGVSSQRPHGVLSNDGDQNIIDAVDYVVSGKGAEMGAVGIIDGQIFSARALTKTDARPGGYKASGGHGGVLGSVKNGEVAVWYRPNYRHTHSSEVSLPRLPDALEFEDSGPAGGPRTLRVKGPDGTLRAEVIPRIYIVKHTVYMEDDDDPGREVEILARVERALQERRGENSPRLHGFVLEGLVASGDGSISQKKALDMAALNGMPVVRVYRNDPGGRVPSNADDLAVEGSNLSSVKARLLLMASMLKLGRLPTARDPKNPTSKDLERAREKISEFQKIFDSH
ncbi:MAG: asparaginase [Nitrososphaerota archaeon]|nr:asparaginase [Nitrososphaerota archaeon]